LDLSVIGMLGIILLIGRAVHAVDFAPELERN